MSFPSVDLQGNVLSAEVLDLIARGEADGQKPAAYSLGTDTTVDRAVGEAWANARTYWKAFADKRGKLKEGDSGVTITRRNWITLLLGELGYELEAAEPEVLNEKPYPISHRASNRGGLPVHIMGVQDGMDKRRESGRPRLSPHALLQEYLNHSEHVYGLVTNGLQLRLLRDSVRLGRLAYVEFDLFRIMDEEIYSDFAALFRLLHVSRMPKRAETTDESLVEHYHQKGIDDGSRIKELRKAVKEGMEVLANGLLENNPALAQAALDGALKPEDYYRELLRVVYRLLFLIVIEERDLVHPASQGQDDPVGHLREIYRRYYSFGRLRQLTMRSAYVDARQQDLWQSLLSTFRLFENEGYGAALGIAPLGGDLFGKPLRANAYDLHELVLENKQTLRLLEGLTVTQNDQGIRVAVNYNDLDVEELGSIYEGLLELHAVIETSTGKPFFSFTAGSQRKLTGSYYTRHDLVAQLIKTALDPVIEERLQGKRTAGEQEAALLGITVLDPACGSGHFLLAAARKLGQRLAEVRSGEENPGRDWVLPARRDVISRCIHGVDKNPAAIELCRLALWLEAHTSGKPLTFLEHRIRCGDALVGVDRLDRLKEGIPDGAFKPVSGDDNPTASAYKRRNKQFRETKQFDLFGEQLKLDADMDRFAAGYQAVEALRNDDMKDRAEKEARYAKYKSDRGWWKDKVACDLYTYAFFQRYPDGLKANEVVDSELLLKQLNSAGSANAALEGKAIELSERERFFHWPLEFPDVWKRGGFDVVLANPPWEQVELKETEYFAERDAGISNAEGAARKKLIKDLEVTDPAMYAEYLKDLHAFNAARKFIRESGQLYLATGGRTNLYSVFAESIVYHLNVHGRGGFIVPTGIATDDGNKEFFSYLVDEDRLASLFDFQNATAIGRFFPNVHPQYKFTLLTVAGGPLGKPASFGFFLQDVLDMNDPRRVFELTRDDFLRINPNTKTCPIFRTRQDAELTANIYGRLPVLINETLGQNPWSFGFRQGLFNMTSDSNQFSSSEKLLQAGYALQGSRYALADSTFLPLYEGKMFTFYDHRYTDVVVNEANVQRSGQSEALSLDDHLDPQRLPIPRYFVLESAVRGGLEHHYMLGFKKVSAALNERTSCPAILPYSGAGDSVLIAHLDSALKTIAFQSILSSLVLDYVFKQKLSGINITLFLTKQIPFPAPCLLLPDLGRRVELVSSLLELNYSSWDIKAFADDLWREADAQLRQALRTQWEENRHATGGHGWVQPEWKAAYPEIDWDFAKGDAAGKNGGIPFPPFKWDEERRAHLRAELDAYYALLYGLERDELRYILDPKEVHGEDFPGETFRVLKDKEIRRHGEYRTRRLVLEAYDRLRPTWDMPAHLERLRVEYERLQQPAVVVEEVKATNKVAKQKAPKDKAQVAMGFGDEGAAAPKRGRPKKEAYNGKATTSILQFLQANTGMHGKAAILEATGVDAKEWNAAIKQLVEDGKVVMEGAKKGARYGGGGSQAETEIDAST